MVAYGKGLPPEVESQRSLTRRELGTSTFCKIVASRRHPSISRVYIEKYLQLKYAVSTPEKISNCLIGGRNESLGNDDVSIVLLSIIIIVMLSSSYNRGHNLLTHFRKTQHKLIRLMNTSIASLPSLNVGFTSLLHLGHKRLPNQH